MVEARGVAAPRDGEVQAGVLDHPLGVVGLLDGGRGAEERRIEADALGEILDGHVDMESFHRAFPFVVGAQEDEGAQRESSVSTVAMHSPGIPWQQLRVRNVIRAAIRSKFDGVHEEPRRRARGDQPGMDELLQVEGKRRRRHRKALGDSAGRVARRPGFDQMPENREARLVREGGQACHGIFDLHISSIMEMT